MLWSKAFLVAVGTILAYVLLMLSLDWIYANGLIVPFVLVIVLTMLTVCARFMVFKK